MLVYIDELAKIIDNEFRNRDSEDNFNIIRNDGNARVGRSLHIRC